ncbi:Isochorismatase hydrolase [Aulographum hederae CBS 113979]|uniref:Isochorismatase hydrolase n=1 Tax=Aulographum hederae CBS 113979 TaxID=1176131 RepID=A0A6G1HDD6_9PEZI|nr:Isochorismatase hydrolase [Aulographum hederae CBS 113979]
MAAPVRRLVNPALFICDLQEKFRPAIYEYAKVISTTQKVLKAAKILNIPVFATTQQRAKLGETCDELGLDAPNGIKTKVHADKSLFSMWTPEVQTAVSSLAPTTSSSEPRTIEAVIVGIESHICVTQTTLDLLRAGHKVYILADGVSSCNKEEVPIALARLRAEGAVVTTSESWLYECMGDAGIEEFRAIAKLVKETKESTQTALQTLCKI